MVLPEGVEGAVVGRHAELRDFLADPRVAKDPRHFAALRRGRVPRQWQLNAFALVKGMTTADGADHRRLRGLVTKAFTPRRIAALRPFVERLTGELLADLPGHAGPDGAVDLREHYAYPLPMAVICELLGVDAGRRAELHGLSRTLVSTSTAPAEAMTAQARIHAVLAEVAADRREHPGDDLTSALIAARDSGTEAAGPERLTAEELAGTLLLMIVAGHETTMNLIVNAVRALCAHPGQLGLVRAGAVGWEAVVEETLRWDAPVANFPFRYPVDDLAVGDTRIPRGTPVLAGYAAAGRDPRAYGPDAGRFDVTRFAQGTGVRHLSFGHGAHYCLGAPLARLEAATALEALFTVHPGLAVAVPEAELPPLPGFVGNSVAALPVRLNG